MRTARGLLVPLTCVVLLLGGCGGDDSSGGSSSNASGGSSGDASGDATPGEDPSSDEPGNTGTDGEAGDKPSDSGKDNDIDEPDEQNHHDGHGEHASHECVGQRSGALTLTSGEDTALPGGSSAAVETTDLEADPPVVSLALGESTRIERENASALSVGDQFGLQRAVYEVVGICDDEVVLNEF